MLEITEVYKKAEQGYAGAYYCRAEDGNKYWIKGHNCQRIDQIKEWICAHLAQAFGLPFPQFCLLRLNDEVYDCLPKSQQEIGLDPVFATQDVTGAEWLPSNFNNQADPEFAEKLLVFDLWIRNMDRSDDNPNLLFDSINNRITVIDHNLAFDNAFNQNDFFNLHIFRDYKALFSDLLSEQKFAALCQQALIAYQQAIKTIPDEWQWCDLEQTIPTGVDYTAFLAILNQYQQSNFWGCK